MRPKRLTLGIVAVTLAVIGGGTAALRRANDTEKVKAPVLTFEQTDTAITLRIRNVNKHWGLRGQKVRIFVRHPDGIPFNSYGPDKDSGVTSRPELGTMHCCEITELRPGGVYTFTLFPSRYKLGGVTVDLKGPPGWIKM